MHNVRWPREAFEELRSYLAEREHERFRRVLTGKEPGFIPMAADSINAHRELLESADHLVGQSVISFVYNGRTTMVQAYEQMPIPPVFESCEVRFYPISGRDKMSIHVSPWSVRATVIDGDVDMTVAYELLDYVEAMAAKYPVRAEKETPSIFIGHGGDQQWRELRDALRDHHHLHIEAFETTPRAGHNIQTVLEQMMSRVNMALLVMTAADETTDGRKLARQNVVHEVGLLQSRLGWDRAIVLLEDGVEEPSNLAGTQQIRFRPGQIAGAVGEVVAEVNRRFPG